MTSVLAGANPMINIKHHYVCAVQCSYKGYNISTVFSSLVACGVLFENTQHNARGIATTPHATTSKASMVE